MRSVQPSRSSVVSKLPATKCVVMHVLVLVACLLVGKSLHVSLELSFVFPQSCTHHDLLSRNILGLGMRMFPPQRWYHPSVMSTDGLTVLATG